MPGWRWCVIPSVRDRGKGTRVDHGVSCLYVVFPEREGALDSVVWGETNAGLGKARVKCWLDQPEVLELVLLVDTCKKWSKGQSVSLDWCNEAFEEMEQFVDVVTEGAEDAALVVGIVFRPGCLLVGSWSEPCG